MGWKPVMKEPEMADRDSSVHNSRGSYTAELSVTTDSAGYLSVVATTLSGSVDLEINGVSHPYSETALYPVEAGTHSVIMNASWNQSSDARRRYYAMVEAITV